MENELPWEMPSTHILTVWHHMRRKQQFLPYQMMGLKSEDVVTGDNFSIKVVCYKTHEPPCI